MSVDAGSEAAQEQPQQSLSTAAARNLATTTKTVPQMQGITSRWLLASSGCTRPASPTSMSRA